MRIAAYAMHGEVKMRKEGLRTRDGHVLEWLARRNDLSLAVYSRPEPFPRLTLARRSGRQNVPESLILVSPETLAIPPLRNPKQWWLDSLSAYPPLSPACEGVIVWNPLAGARAIGPASAEVKVACDLLDDWTIHPHFAPMREEIEAAYRLVFDRADHVTANSEGTVALAARFGRTDVELLPNGCDPGRFETSVPLPTERPIVGYGGKLGSRVDFELIRTVAESMPEIHFQFAGPVLDRGCLAPIENLPNVECLGDVPYSEYPAVVQRWTIGWAPHRVGEGEVGGDAMKIYEYAAAGLPVVMTPIIGHDRSPSGVVVVRSAADAIESISSLLAGVRSGEVVRSLGRIPQTSTWSYIADRIVAGCLPSVYDSQ